MAGRKLGDVFFVVSPETKYFRAETDAGIKRAIAGMKVTVPVGADARSAIATIDGLQAKMKAVAARLSDLRIGADDKAAEAVIVRLQAKLAALAKAVSAITMTADTTKLDASIAREKAKLEALRLAASDLKMDADSTAAVAKIAALEAQAFHLGKSLDKLTADVDIDRALTKIYAIEAELKVLRSRAEVIRLDADSKAITAAITATEASIADLSHKAADIKLGASIDTGKLLTAEAGLLGIEAAVEKLTPVAVKGDAALGALGAALTGTGTGWGFLTRNIALFGGIFNRVLPMVATSVAVWHVLADAVIEVAAVWIPAGLAVGAFAIAASDAATEIQRRMTAVHTVMDATGQSVPPLTRAMENLHNAVRPQVYQLFGDALTVMNSRTGTFAQVAKQTGTVIDQLAARMVYAVTAGNKLGTSTTQLSGFWKTAITDASKLGDSIGNLFGIFGNLFRAIPGFAAGLLTIGDDFTKILETASAAAIPVLKWVLLLHGYILYTGLAVTGTLAFIGAVANLAKQFVTFAAGSVLAGVGALKAFGSTLVSIGLALAGYVESIIVADGASASFAAALAPLAANPMIWVAAAAVALGGLVYWLVTSKDAAQQFNASMQQTIQNAPLSNVVTVIQQAQASTAAQLAAANVRLAKTTKANSVEQLAAARAGGNANRAYQQAQLSAFQYQQGLQQVNAQAALVNGRVGALSKTYGGNTAALGILNAAGITTTQITDTNAVHWAQALIQVNSTIAAYQAMGIQAGVLGNDLDVLGRTVTDQYAAVQKLNQAWGSFISDVTGTQGSFDTVAQGFSTLDDHSGNLILRLGKLRVSYKDSQAAIDSLTPAGVALNQAFGDQVVNIDKLFSSWRTAGVAGNLFNQGVAAAIAPMEKYAVGSQEATAQLIALAQEAGYQGPVSLQAMNKYLGISNKMLGDTAGATQKVKDVTNQATVQEALLTGAMQSQGAVIANQLIGDINSAILAYDGVAKAAAGYGTAIAQYGKGSSQANTAQRTLTDSIIKAGLASNSTAGQIEATLAKVLGISMPAAIAIFNAGLLGSTQVSGNVTQAIVGDFQRQQKAADTAGAGISAYTDAIRGNGVDSGQAHSARDQLIKDMTDAGVNASTASTDVAHYTAAVLANGIDSSQAASARAQLISDILGASNNAKTGQADLATYNQMIRTNQQNTDAGKSARNKLIQDLVNAGLSAKDATALVQGLQTNIDKMHGTTVTIIATANGTGEIAITGSGWALGSGNIRFHAAQGLYVNQGTGPTADDVLIRASKGELIVPANIVSSGAVDNLRGRIPGFAGGGFVGLGSMLAGVPGTAGQIAGADAGRAVAAGITEAMAAAKAAVEKAAAAASGAGGIVKFAESFIGKIPYVWGGTSLGPAGADCSGFTQAVYGHFGIRAPRTSEAQGAWVKVGAPTPGGLAFYHSSPGGPDPGHVAIVANASSVVSQGGGIGPQMMALTGLPLLFTGTPPGGFPGGSGGTAPAGVTGLYSLTQLEALWDAAGGNPRAANNMGRIALAESGGNPRAFNASGASGLWQILGQVVAGNIFDPFINAENAVSKYNSSGYLPWVSDPVASALIASGLTYAAGGIAGQRAPFSRHAPAGPGIPGMAGGGTTSALRARLAAEQAGERAKYSGLGHAFATGPAKYRTRSVMNELATLARRQTAEQAAYASLSGAGLTTSALHHLGAEARAELRTAGDKALSKAPGGHPGFAADLRKYLSQLSATASGTVAGGGTAGALPATAAGIAALRKSLAAAQKGERAKYFGLGHSFAIGPAKYRTKSVLGELGTLAERQAAETAAYAALAGSGLTRASLSHLGAEARAEMRTAADKGLSKMPGGHPLWARDLGRFLAALSTLSGTPVPAPGGGGGGTAHPPNPPWNPGNLGPSHSVPGGVLTFDKGGLWPSGTLGWNGSGRTETVLPGGGGDMHLHLTVNGPVGSQAELEDWYVRTANKMARTGRLSQAVKRAQGH